MTMRGLGKEEDKRIFCEKCKFYYGKVNNIFICSSPKRIIKKATPIRIEEKYLNCYDLNLHNKCKLFEA